MLEYILNQAAIITAIISGLFAFYKWIDTRNRALKNERYQQYIRHIKILAGSKETDQSTICMTEQIAAAWLLIEYKEFHHITIKILDNDDLENMSAEPWKKFVLPHIKKVISEVKHLT